MIDPELIRRMRAAQIAYFASRTQGRLAEAMRLEKMVDTELEKIEQPIKPQQNKLWQ